MNDDAVGKLARSLGRYQAIVVGGLCFIVALAITLVGVMVFLAFNLGAQSQRLEGVAKETHDALCALYFQTVEENRQSIQLLKDSPLGLLDKNGNIVIAADLIQRGIDQRKETIDALKQSGLTC